MSNLRFQVVEEAFKKHALEVETPSKRPSEYFGKYVFDRKKMFKYLSKEVYDKLVDVIDHGPPSVLTSLIKARKSFLECICMLSDFFL